MKNRQIEDEHQRVNDFLRQRGVEHDITDLRQYSDLSPGCAPQLLELLRTKMSLEMTWGAADALFIRKPSASVGREAAGLLLKVLRDHKGENCLPLEQMALNNIPGKFVDQKVEEVGDMVLDSGYAEGVRFGLLRVLGEMRTPRKINYLLKAAEGPGTAAVALDVLGRLVPEQAMTLSTRVLIDVRLDSESREVINEIRAKLKRKLAAKKQRLPHVTKTRVPSKLEEWSMNMDGQDVKRASKALQRCINKGFSQREIAEVVAAADRLSLKKTVRLRFVINAHGKRQPLWVELFRDDEEEFEFFIYGSERLIDAVTKAQARLFKGKFTEI